MGKFKSKICLIGAILVANLMTQVAYADLVLTGNYYSFQYVTLQTDVNRSFGLLKLNLGTKLNETFAYEGQLGLGSESTTKDGLVTYGVYLRANKRFDDEYVVYGLAGLGGIEGYGRNSGSQNSFSAGIGAEAIADKSFSLTIELVQQLYKSEIKAYSVGIGWTYYFYKDDSRFNKAKRIRSIREYYR